MTITLIPTALRGVRVASLRTSELATSDMAAEYELAANEDLLDLVPDAPVDLRTQPQVELMNRLMADLRALDPAAAAQGDTYMHEMTMRGMWTPGRDGNASRWIDRLINRIKAARAAGRPAVSPKVELADGVYRYDGQLYMVQHAVHGSGNQYAKRIMIELHVEGERVPTEYARGIVSRLTPEMALSADEAKVFGEVYGQCVFCLKPLTDDRSKAAGYGRKCADNHGLPWG